MDDLRWALLLLGVLFIVGLTWWELRKPRHAGRDADEEFTTLDAEATNRRRIEPRFDETVDHTNPHDTLPSMRSVDVGSDPPLMVLDDVREHPMSMDIGIVSEVAIDQPGMSASEPPAETLDLDVTAEEQPVEVPPFDVPSEAVMHEPPRVRREPPQPNWPDEDKRRLISIRLVPRAPARFQGRTLRLAFEGCGLEYGAFDIFHLVDDSGEVFASAANLMRPGTFSPETMDGQYFLGVHLFCVLPGPLPAGRAVDELVALARDLGQRVSGSVLNDVGEPMDEERVAAVRAAAEAAEDAR